jgi:ketosteroid isomerase-like protein
MEMIGAANALDQQFMDAFNKGDVNAVMALYWNSPDLAFYPPDAMGLRGWTASNAAMTGTFTSRPGAKLEILESRNDVEGTVVLGSGRWKLTIPAAKGPAAVVEGRYTDVKAQKDGRWVYLVDHASVPLPPGAGKGKQ